MEEFFSSPINIFILSLAILIVPLSLLRVKLYKKLREPKSKQTARMIVMFYITLTLLLVGGAIGLSIWQNKDSAKNPVMTKEEAIEQANEYSPTHACITVVTPAVHKQTGAKYTFSSGCLPPGWEAGQ